MQAARHWYRLRSKRFTKFWMRGKWVSKKWNEWGRVGALWFFVASRLRQFWKKLKTLVLNFTRPHVIITIVISQETLKQTIYKIYLLTDKTMPATIKYILPHPIYFIVLYTLKHYICWICLKSDTTKVNFKLCNTRTYNFWERKERDYTFPIHFSSERGFPE